MGFAGRAVARFNAANHGASRAADPQPTTSAAPSAPFPRVLRMILQSAVLGLGAYLTIKGELSAGAIIAASVASARALAPVDLAIGNWKGVVAARTAFSRLSETVIALGEAADADGRCRHPVDSLKVEKITVAAPGIGPRPAQRSRVSSSRPGRRSASSGRAAAARRRWHAR